MAKKQWSELSPLARKAIIVGGALEFGLTTYAWRDLGKRPRDQVRGPKLLWRLAGIVQPVGPLAYLVLGRRSA